MSPAVKVAVAFAGGTALFVLTVLDWQALRGWWADRVTVWRLRAEWRRRQRAKRAAQAALDPGTWTRDPREPSRPQMLAMLVIVGALIALAFVAGCDGTPLPDPEPAADAGADVTPPSPDAGTDTTPVAVTTCEVPQGQSFLATPCPGLPHCAACTYTAPGFESTVAGCHPPFQPEVTCAARCGECVTP